MGFDGYQQVWCSNGHENTIHQYDEEPFKCETCGSKKILFHNTVDCTNEQDDRMILNIMFFSNFAIYEYQQVVYDRMIMHYEKIIGIAELASIYKDRFPMRFSKIYDNFKEYVVKHYGDIFYLELINKIDQFRIKIL